MCKPITIEKVSKIYFLLIILCLSFVSNVVGQKPVVVKDVANNRWVEEENWEIVIATYSMQKYSGLRAEVRVTDNTFNIIKPDSIERYNLINFGDTRIVDEVDFSKAKFETRADFKETQFEKLANFEETKFKYQVNFGNTRFENKISFWETHFEDDVTFQEVVFKDIANFSQSKFLENADFRNTNFERYANFSRASFNWSANFKGSKFLSLTDFTSSKLPKYLNFSQISQIKGEIDLTTTYLDANRGDYFCYINLLGSNIENIKLDYDKFRLWFPPRTKIENQRNVYERVLNKFQQNGFQDSYITLDIEYQGFNYDVKASKNWWQWLIFKTQKTLDKLWWNYGYNKERIIYWVVVFYCLFLFINLRSYRFLHLKVYPVDSVWKAYIKKYPLYERKKLEGQLQRKIFVLPYVMLYTGFIFLSFKMSLEKIKNDHLAAVFYIYFQYFIGLICLAYLANFIISG